MKTEIKLEKMRLQHEQDKMLMLQIDSMLKNPLIEWILGMLFIGYITRGTQSTLERLTGMDLTAGSLGLGLTGVITAQQLSAALPYLATAGKDAAPMIAGLLK